MTWSRRSPGILLLVALLTVPGALQAQRTTERFIPVGQSPGLSGTTTVIGEIQSVDRVAGTLSIVTEGGARAVRILPGTAVWLDRSTQGLTNVGGSTDDLQVGRRVEVRFVNDEPGEGAEWIKVVVPAGG